MDCSSKCGRTFGKRKLDRRRVIFGRKRRKKEENWKLQTCTESQAVIVANFRGLYVGGWKTLKPLASTRRVDHSEIADAFLGKTKYKTSNVAEEKNTPPPPFHLKLLYNIRPKCWNCPMKNQCSDWAASLREKIAILKKQKKYRICQNKRPPKINAHPKQTPIPNKRPLKTLVFFKGEVHEKRVPPK